MNIRFASVAAALALGLSAATTPVLAQSATINVWGARFDAPVAQPRDVLGTPRDVLGTPRGVLEGRGEAADTMTTGSLDRQVRPRGTDGSAYRYSGAHAGGPANGLPR